MVGFSSSPGEERKPREKGEQKLPNQITDNEYKVENGEGYDKESSEGRFYVSWQSGGCFSAFQLKA